MTDPVRLQLHRQRGFSLQALSEATNGLEVVNVARPGFWGNWACAGELGRLWLDTLDPDGLRLTVIVELAIAVSREDAVTLHRSWLTMPEALLLACPLPDGWDRPVDGRHRMLIGQLLFEKRRATLERLPELAGKNVACFCKLDAPCHGDTLMELANR